MLQKLAELDSRMADRSQLKAGTSWAMINSLGRKRPSSLLCFSSPSNAHEKDKRMSARAYEPLPPKLAWDPQNWCLYLTIDNLSLLRNLFQDLLERWAGMSLNNIGLCSISKMEQKKCILWYKWICFVPTHSCPELTWELLSCVCNQTLFSST